MNSLNKKLKEEFVLQARRQIVSILATMSYPQNEILGVIFAPEATVVPN